MCFFIFFFFNDTATTEIYTLSLHDALPIFYPENIETLFKSVDVGVKVRLVDQPYKVGWLNGELYLEAHEALGQDPDIGRGNKTPVVKAIIEATQEREANIEWARLGLIADRADGMPVKISLSSIEKPDEVAM